MWVCVSDPKASNTITNSMMQQNMNPYDWLKSFYSFFIPAIVGIIRRCDLTVEVCCGNQPNNSNLALYKLLIHFYQFQTLIILYTLLCGP